MSTSEEFLTRKIPEHAFGNIRSLHASRGAVPTNRHGTAKTVASVGATLGSLGATAATTATGQSAIALGTAIAAGVAVSATGVGLVVGGAVLAAGSMAASARSMYKTNKHLDNLLELLAVKEQYAAECRQSSFQGGGGAEHAIIEQVLIYIINQKRSKLFKKGLGAAGLGLATGLQRGGRAVWKGVLGTKGEKRTFAAQWLTKHLITTNCGLAQAIVVELLDPATMEWLKLQDSEMAAPIIAGKMKSI